MEDASKEVQEQTSDFTPDPAEAVNEGVDTAAEGKGEGPGEIEKKILSPEEMAKHDRMVINKLLIERTEELDKIVTEIKEKGYTHHSYGPDTEVTIKGNLFAGLLNYIVAVQAHNDNIRTLLSGVVDANDSLTLGSLDLQVILTQKHLEFAEAGISHLTEEAKQELEARERVQEVFDKAAQAAEEGTREPDKASEEEE